MTSPHDIDAAIAIASFDGIVAALRYAVTAIDGARQLENEEIQATGSHEAAVRHTSRCGELEMMAKLLVEDAPEEPEVKPKSKVFCIGLSRTGTTSLHHALQTLGYDSVHFKLGERFIDHEIIETHNAFSDSNIAMCYKVLDKKYPGSTFIYTYRDLETWLDTYAKVAGPLSTIKDEDRPILQEIRHHFYDCDDFDREKWRAGYIAHQDDVADYFRDRDDCLWLDVCSGQGWELLCPFLERRFPASSFPWSGHHQNLPWQVSPPAKEILQ